MNKEKSIDEVISDVIDLDEVFLSKMDAQGFDFINDDEYDFISGWKIGYQKK